MIGLVYLSRVFLHKDLQDEGDRLPEYLHFFLVEHVVERPGELDLLCKFDKIL